MFSLKQLSTIKNALDEESISTASEKLEQKKSDHEYKNINLILATDRLQEIYKEVCTGNLDFEGSPTKTETLKLLEEISEKEPKKVILELFNSNKFLSNRLNEAYKAISELKENISMKYLPKIKRLESEVKKHSMLEETWHKSRDALIQENKILLKQMNKNENRIKGIRKLAEKKMKKKYENLKKKLSRDKDLSDYAKKKNSKEENGVFEGVQGEIMRSLSELGKKKKLLSKVKSSKSVRRSTNQNHFSERVGSSKNLLKRVFSEKKIIEEKDKKIKNLKIKINQLEKKRKDELKRKLSEAFDKFEEEKRKIIDYFKLDKKRLEEENERFSLELIKKERIEVRIDEERILEKRQYEKLMLSLEEEKHQFEMERGKVRINPY